MDKEQIRLFMYGLFSVLNKFIPKKNRVFVYGGDRMLDNSEAMFRYLAENTDIDILCISDQRMEKYDRYQHVLFKKNTLWNALTACLTSKVILDSSLHTVKMRPSEGQKFIQMWHGSPLKHLSGNGRIRNADYYSYIFYASDLFKNELQNSMGADESQMVLAGGPRNDYLFSGVELPEIYRNKEGKSIIWLPTFRRGIGRKETEKDIPVLTRDNIPLLESFLRRHGMKLFIKPHPLQMGGFSELIPAGRSHPIHLVSDAEMLDNDIALYELLGCMDALITDYSSVYFDYLLLDRPIGFAADDFEEYERNRGFAFENPRAYMPGYFITDFQNLLTFLETVDAMSPGEDRYQDARHRVNEIANYHKDYRNCERCAEIILDALE